MEYVIEKNVNSGKSIEEMIPLSVRLHQQATCKYTQNSFRKKIRSPISADWTEKLLDLPEV